MEPEIAPPAPLVVAPTPPESLVEYATPPGPCVIQPAMPMASANATIVFDNFSLREAVPD
jgi:hypothetical protein